MHSRRASTAALVAFVVAVSSSSAIVVGDQTTQTQTLTQQRQLDDARRSVRTDQLILAIDRLLANKDYPPDPTDMNAVVDRDILTRGLISKNAAQRAIAVRGVGQFQHVEDAPGLISYLDDADDGVRRAAANALVQSLTKVRGAGVLPAMRAMQAHVAIKDSTVVVSGGVAKSGPNGVLESIGRLHYDDATAYEVETWIAGLSGVTPAEKIGALTDLMRTAPNHRLQATTIAMLRGGLTPSGDAPLMVEPASSVTVGLSLELLLPVLTDSAADTTLIVDALQSRCPPPAPGSCGWELRRKAASVLNTRRGEFAEALDLARRDPAYQVRIEVLRRYGVEVPKTGNCAPLIDAIVDNDEPYTIVKLEALTLLQPNCEGLDKILARLTDIAGDVDGEDARVRNRWHLPARAIETLARIAPETVPPFIARARTHDVWQVRAAIARAAGRVKDEDTLLVLVRDVEPNVQTEALKALNVMRSPAVFEHAERLLESSDHQVVLTAANLLPRTPDPARAITPLLDALKRLTREQADTSRDPRVAILKTLSLFGPAQLKVSPLPLSTINADFVPYLKDFEPEVAKAAADVLAARNGVRPVPTPSRRPVAQPTEEQMKDDRQYPGARFLMASGEEFDVAFLWDEAPLSTVRFIEEVQAHRFDGLTFHRVVPLFVVQGGSPGANEYSGEKQYQRDEIGFARHTSGAVGVSTRGRDTGDGQIFIDLGAQPTLDYIYTVFARVLDHHLCDSPPYPPAPPPPPALQNHVYALDAMLEGAKITRVTLLSPCK